MSDPVTSLADGILIANCLAGDQKSFDEIVRRYQVPLLRVAKSRLLRDDWAEDAVQETFLCTVKSIHTYDSRYSFRTWLWTILLNQCRRVAARDARRPAVRSWSDQNPSEENELLVPFREPTCRAESPPTQLLLKERAEQLQRMLNQLSEVQADALRLRFFGELKFQEIADAMDCSLSSAKNRVRWGLMNIAKMLALDEEETHEAGKA